MWRCLRAPVKQSVCDVESNLCPVKRCCRTFTLIPPPRYRRLQEKAQVLDALWSPLSYSVLSGPVLSTDLLRCPESGSSCAQMHLRLFAILPLLSSALMFNSPARRGSANKEASEDCRPCLECSRDNGCLSCLGKLFLFLRREGMWHHGSCLQSCPAGYYGVRGQDMNRCMKCKAANCERCFSKDFCTKCKQGFKLFKGRCLRSCPEGTYPHLTDCIEGCLLGPWGEWTSCEHNGVTCGFRWGRQSRTRVSSSNCPAQSEDRKCRMKKRCPTQRRANERKGKGKRRRKEQKSHQNTTLMELPGEK